MEAYVILRQREESFYAERKLIKKMRLFTCFPIDKNFG